MIRRLLLRSSFRQVPSCQTSLFNPSLSQYPHHSTIKPTTTSTLRLASHSTRSPVDSKIEEIQDLYATARDEFEIASEETEKKTVYAADDRAAAQEELGKLKAAFDKAVTEEGGEEIKTRVGGRIRELERAVEAMEQMAMED